MAILPSQQFDLISRNRFRVHDSVAVCFCRGFAADAQRQDNRANLPALDTTGVADQLEFVAPRDKIERRLQTIWEEILDVRPIGVRHEFFALGGHSLSAARVLFRIKREFSSDIPLAAMFQAPTIEGLAAKIRGDSSDEALFATVPIQPHGSRAPLFVVGGFRAFRQLPKHLGEDQPLIGLTVPDELKMRLPYDLAEFAAHQVNYLEDPEGRPLFRRRVQRRRCTCL